MDIHRPVEVLVWHDSPLVCAGLAATLREQSDLNVTVGASLMAVVATQAARCDVLIADYCTGLRCIDVESASREPGGHPKPRLLIVTTKVGEWDICHAMSKGVHGYLLLGCPAGRLVDAVRSLARGQRCYDDAVSARMADSLVYATLTRREHDVLSLMSLGAGNKHIARSLDIQVGTVKAHVKSVLEKLQVGTRTQAVVVAESRGLLRALPADDIALARFRDQMHGRRGVSLHGAGESLAVHQAGT